MTAFVSESTHLVLQCLTKCLLLFVLYCLTKSYVLILVSVPSSGSKQQTSQSFTRSQTTGAQSTLPANKPVSAEAGKQEPATVGEKLAKIFPMIRVLQVQVRIFIYFQCKGSVQYLLTS